jgi:hypothetical protein
MITDKLTIFSGAVSSAGAISGQAITGAASVVSTNSYDTGPRAIGSNQAVKLGAGEPLKVVVNVRVAPADPTSVAFQLIQADDAALTSNVQVLNDSGTIAIASLVAGVNIELPFRRPDPLAAKRYVGVRYVITGTNTNAGTYFAAAVADFADVQTSYKSGYTLS